MLDYRKNCFNLIRLIAAMQVFLVHAVVHLKINYTFKAIGFLNGVPIFFFLSGFLIWSSIERTADFRVYFQKRVLRIYPELWIGVAISILSILILNFKDINWMDLGTFAITQSTFMQFWTPDSLRGFGCGTPNGSLWTICVIVQFYLLAWFLHKLLKRKRDWIMVILSAVALSVVLPFLKPIFPNEVLYKLFGQTVFPHLWMFLFGALVWSYRETMVPILKRIWWIAPVILVFAEIVNIPHIGGTYDLLDSLCVFILITGFAYKFPKLNIKYDISYGIYIYHMIVVNVLIELSITKSWYAVLLAVLVTALLAITSYFINSKMQNRLRCKKCKSLNL